MPGVVGNESFEGHISEDGDGVRRSDGDVVGNFLWFSTFGEVCFAHVVPRWVMGLLVLLIHLSSGLVSDHWSRLSGLWRPRSVFANSFNWLNH